MNCSNATSPPRPASIESRSIRQAASTQSTMSLGASSCAETTGAPRRSQRPDSMLAFVAELSYLFRYKSSELARLEMDFSLTPKTEELRKRVSAFMDQYVIPIEKDVQRAMGESGNEEPQSLKDVRKKAKAEGLWNLFLPDEKFGAGLKNYEY